MQPNGAAFRRGIWKTSRLLTRTSAANFISSVVSVPNWILAIFFGAEDSCTCCFRSAMFADVNGMTPPTHAKSVWEWQGHNTARTLNAF
jgi:hypothetical protein